MGRLKMDQRRSGKLHGTSLVTAVVEQFLFSGLILGWASLVYILKEEKIFAELCDEPASGRVIELGPECQKGCAAQDARFNKIFVIAVTTYELASAFLGWIFDTIGTGYTRILIIIMETCGLLMLALTSPST